MKKITDKYYLDSDSLNYILMEKHTYEKGKNIGEDYYTNVGYYGSLKYLYKTLIELEIKENLDLLDNIKNIVDLIEKIEEVENERRK
jgi:hypothetical protein